MLVESHGKQKDVVRARVKLHGFCHGVERKQQWDGYVGYIVNIVGISSEIIMCKLATSNMVKIPCGIQTLWILTVRIQTFME